MLSRGCCLCWRRGVGRALKSLWELGLLAVPLPATPAHGHSELDATQLGQLFDSSKRPWKSTRALVVLAAGLTEGKWLLGVLTPRPVASPVSLHCFHLQQSGGGAWLSKNMFAQPLLPCLASPTMVLSGVVANVDGQSMLLDEYAAQRSAPRHSGFGRNSSSCCRMGLRSAAP